MHFDLKITMGDLLTAASILGAGLAVFWRMSQFVGLFREYPPHRHIDDEDVVYPKGMRPEPIQHTKGVSQ